MKKATKQVFVVLLVLLAVISVLTLCSCKLLFGDVKGKLSVTYDNSHKAVEGESLDSLKPYLTVTYTDKDGNVSTITDFTLSGTLSKGESKVKVAYNGVTYSITVNVLEKQQPDNPNPPQLQEYTVTFKADGQLVSLQKYTAENKTVAVPEVPAKTGYNGVWEEYTLTTGNVTVNAVYTAKQYTVTLNYDGAATGNEQQTLAVTYNQPVGALPTPIKTGYEFKGWLYNDEAVTSESVWTTDGNAAFVAQWQVQGNTPNPPQPEEYTVTFKADGQVVFTQKYTAENKTITVPSVPEKEGYTGVWEEYELTTGDLTVNAMYTAIEYTVTFVADDQTVDTCTYTVENKIIDEPTVPSKTGYIGVWVEYELITGDLTVNAVYTAKQYTIMLDYQGATAGNEQQTLTVTYNQLVGSLPTPEKTGYEFAGWKYGTNIVTSTTVWKTDSNAIFVAQWELVIKELSYELNADGQSYSVIGIGTITESDIIVPSTYNDKPVVAINDRAFDDLSALTSVVIPDSVTSIGNYAFSGCGSLESITVASGNAKYHDAGNCLIETASKTLIAGCKNSVIPVDGSVTSIGNYAFSGCSSLTSITIPDSVINIGSSAFNGCSSLESITLPFVGGSAKTSRDTYQYPLGYIFGASSYTSGIATKQYYYGNSASWTTNNTYYIPKSLKSVTITGGNILYGAFSNCSLLTSITIPNSVTSIGDYAFSGCGSLTNITIPNSVTNIGNYAFSGCGSLTSVMFEANSKYASIGEMAFYNCNSLISVTIGKGVTSIGDYAFSDCTSLISVTISNSVTSIGAFAFSDCTSLTNITIPNSVTSIGSSVFYGCSSLESLTIPFVGAKKYEASNTHFGYIFGASSYSSNSSSIPSSLKIVAITGGSSICENAFNGCSSLTSVTIGNGVTSIGSSAFNGCSSLENITLPFVGGSAKTSSNTYQYPFGYIFGTSSYTGGTATKQYYYGSSTSSTTNDTYYIPSSLKAVIITGGDLLYGAFYNCSSLTSVIISNSVTSVGNYAFSYCNSLTSVTLGNSVTSIGSSAFAGCGSLTSITIPNSVTNISSSAFAGCTSLESITLPFVGGSAKTSGDAYQYPFGYIFGRGSYVGGADTEQYYCGFSTSSTINDTYCIPRSLKSVTITGGNILYGAFSNCSLLTSITIPNSVTSIGSSAFSGCGSLTSIIIPNGVTSIGYGAFSNCSSLTSITIPNSVTSISDRAFDGCNKLANINYLGTIKSLCEQELYNLMIYGTSSKTLSIKGEQVTELVIPSTVTSIQSYAFAKTNITSVTIPDCVTSIGSSAFYNCSALTSITIPSSVTSIGSYAFRDCSAFTIYCEVASKPSGWDSNWNYSNCSVVWDCKNNDKDPNGYSYAVIDGIRYSLKDNVAMVIGQPSNIIVANIPESVTYKDANYSVTNIGEDAFRNCSSLISITIPNSVTSIGSSAFNGCSSLISITIPNSVTSIGNYAFLSCRLLTSVTIGNSVTSIGSSVFNGCSSLVNITVASGNTKYHSVGNCIIATASKILIVGCKNSVIPVDGSVTSIGNYAFDSCSSLISITIPNSVTSIGNYAFDSCSSLTSVTIGNSVRSIDDAFNNCSKLANINYLGTIESWCNIQGLDNLMRSGTSSKTLYINGKPVTELVIPNAVTSIPSDAFKKTNITSVTFEENSQCISIDNYAFSNCSSLTSVTIPNSVTSIGSYAFSGCISLASVTIPNSVTSIGDSAFYNCSSLTIYCEAESKLSGWVSSSQTYNWNRSNCPVVWDCKNNDKDKNGYAYTVIDGIHYSLKDNIAMVIGQPIDITIANIPEKLTYKDTIYKVTSIGANAFFQCSSLTSVTIPNSVTSIGDDAFYYCTSLISITLPDSVTKIGESAFEYCKSLTSISIGNGVTSIGHFAFQGCSLLTSVTIPNSVISIGRDAFCVCSSLTIYCEAESRLSGWNDYWNRIENSNNNYVYSPIVWNCNNNDKDSNGYAYAVIDGIRYSLKANVAMVIGQPINITVANIPESITYKDATYNVRNIGNYAFEYCSSLTSITIPNSVIGIGDGAFDGYSSLTSVYYKGTMDDWAKIGIGSNNSSLISATLYYYSESEPALNADGTAYDGNYWHYVDGVVTVWKKEA